MECPFCVETIKDESLVCRHCARDLALVRPVILEIQAMTAEIDALQRELNRVRIKLNAAEAPGRFLLVHALAYIVLPSVLLVTAHFLVMFKFDVSEIYLRIASVLIPLPFGFVLAAASHIGFRGTLTLGLAAAALSVWSMLAVTGYLDGVPVLPSNWLEWKESIEYGMSIALAFGAGNILAYLLFEVLPRAFTSSGKPSAAAYWIARTWGQHVGNEALRRRARLLQHILRTAGPIIGFAATVSGSIYTGLKGFLVN
jgi:hypothetical protein